MSALLYKLIVMWGVATVLYNYFQDKLYTVTTSLVWNGLMGMDRVNVDNSVINGVELNVRWDIRSAVAI
ncbi:hypothetical protein [Pseudomonas syringae group genomosp. 7]|uniref:hypothetical protein n=1 Tax=Pseudomonas syringae group genomosp. 7 TaxID=251699 RepID=UPI00376FBBCF